MMKAKSVIGGIGLAVMLFSCLPAARAGEEGESPVQVKTDSWVIAESDVNAMDGEVAINQTALDVSYSRKFGRLPVDFSLNTQHIDIKNTSAVELPSHLEGKSLGVEAKFPAPFVDRDDVFMGLAVYPSMYTDDWQWHDSAFRMPLRTYWIYKQCEELILIAGLMIRPNYDTAVLPFAGFIYRPDERWTFHFASNEPKIFYQIDDKTRLFAELGYTSDEYEVERAGQQGVVLKYRFANSGLGMSYSPVKSLEASVSAGVVFARRLEYLDGQGKVEPDGAGYARAKLNWKF